MRFANQVVVITGASSGIGHALARAMAREGARVGLTARRGDLLAELADTITREGGLATYAPADVADRLATVTAIRELAARLGPVDLLVANAGVGTPSLLEPLMNVDDLERMFRVNVFGIFYAFEAVLPEMLKRGRGHLAAVSSLAAYKGLPGESGYSSSKAAVNNYCEGLRIQLRGRGIHLTTICPGFIKTPMTAVNQFKMPWLLEADEAARRIVGALHKKKKVFNFPWQMSLVMKLAAWLPDWAIARTMHSYNEKPPMPLRPV